MGCTHKRINACGVCRLHETAPQGECRAALEQLVALDVLPRLVGLVKTSRSTLLHSSVLHLLRCSFLAGTYTQSPLPFLPPNASLAPVSLSSLPLPLPSVAMRLTRLVFAV